MIHKLLQAILDYIEELERKYKLKTIDELKEKIKKEAHI